MDATKSRVRKSSPKQPTKAQLREQLAAALARAEGAETALAARPATATPPPGGRSPLALQAPAPGVVRVWLMTDSEGYRLQLIHLAADGVGWAMSKWSDGTVYHLFEAPGADLISCDCPGCTAHGPACAGGKGCKHARMLKALRQLVDPGV